MIRKLFSGLTGGNILVAAIATLLLLALIFAGVRSCERAEDKDNANLVNQGVTTERAETQGEVLNNVKNAQDAVDNATPADKQRVCEKYDRNCASRN